MHLRPLQDKLVVKRAEHEVMTKSGIFFPDAAKKDKPIKGQVLAVGNGKLQEDGSLRPLDIKAGDTILFTKYAGTEIQVEGEDLLIIREEDVLGVVE